MDNLPISWNSFKENSFFSSLDGLRCISIIAVIWHHSPSDWNPLFLSKGFLGVDIFFVISGFLIVTLILREKEKYKQFSIKNFYIRRSLRIFPPYYFLILVLMLYFLTAGKGGSQAKGFFEELPYVLTYTSNWVHITTFLGITWSLSTEEQFYIVWPTIERFFSKFIFILLPFFIFFNILLLYRYIDIESIIGLKYSDFEILQVTFTPILLGVLLAYMLNGERTFNTFSKLMNKPWCSLVYLVLIFSFASLFDDVTGTPRLLIHISAALLIGSCVISENDWLSHILTNRLIARIGVVSYGMYLYHMLAIHFTSIAFQKIVVLQYTPSFLIFLTNVFVTYLIAELSFHCLEKRFLNLKHKFVRKPSASVSIPE